MDEYLNNFKNKKKSFKEPVKISKKKINTFITKFMISIIFFLVSVIFTNFSDENLLMYKEYVFTESLPFTKIKGWYEDLFGEVLPSDNTQTVFNGELIYKEISDYYDGEKMVVNTNTLVNNLTSGVVVFSGVKENYGNTVIIQGIDGEDILYGNVNYVSVILYDYVEAGTVIGETNGDFLYLVIKKDNEFIKYEDYQS